MPKVPKNRTECKGRSCGNRRQRHG